MSEVQVVGIHPVRALEPVHLIELIVGDQLSVLDWSSITQPVEGQDVTYWQAPYDEREVPGVAGNWCFFFHYLDLARPLTSNLGALPLPQESPLPEHLRFIKYEEP